VSWRAFSQTFVLLLVIMDPIGTAPIFVTLTSGLYARARSLAAVQAAATAGVLVTLFYSPRPPSSSSWTPCTAPHRPAAQPGLAPTRGQ
jgi:MarC family integral membrane protein